MEHVIDAVELQHRAGREIEDALSEMTPEQQRRFWQDANERMHRLASELREKASAEAAAETAVRPARASGAPR